MFQSESEISPILTMMNLISAGCLYWPKPKINSVKNFSLWLVIINNVCCILPRVWSVGLVVA